MNGFPTFYISKIYNDRNIHKMKEIQRLLLAKDIYKFGQATAANPS